MPDLDALTAELLRAPKYRQLDLPPETARALLEQELPRHRTTRAAIKAAREKLHQIVAPYLGDPDYPGAITALQAAFAAGPQQVRNTCAALMQAHASTHERLPLLDSLYPRLFALTGQPQTILDLACALHPLSFPWMGLPNSTRYHAYDLHGPRCQLLAHYFALQGLPPLVEQADILVHPPQIEADVAFFFKEAHRFEQRQHGCNRPFWQALHVRWLLVSLPITDLTGHHSLLERQRRLVYDTLDGLPWPVEEVLIGSEMVFCIRKPD